MTTPHPRDLLTVRAQTGTGSRDWIVRAGRGVRQALRDAAAANRRMGEIRVGRDHLNPF